MKTLKLTAATAFASIFLASSTMAMDGVVASIKPIHSLVAAVMGDTGKPDLLVKGAGSPHTYSLRPSEARMLEGAKVVFWVGDELETFLTKPLESLAANATVVTLSETQGLTLLDVREGGSFEHHDHDHDAHEDHDHDHGSKDMHLWLDPENARVIVKQVAKTLSEADPTNASTYEQNAEAVDQRLATLIEETNARLASVKEKRFIVFHDAYHYFEDRFGLQPAGSISVNPEAPPSAQRVKEIQEKIASANAACVFAEPQFEPRIVTVVTEGTNAKAGQLDPLGANLEDGPDLYFNMIESLATSFVDCMAQ
ncbi:zinc ABC transporter substrate-binding protein [Nitratireductor aestuarii]|uniref:High-affinity zinc uptake system protein ZnuA n=1 Tax=Nitratireductor aestuarii TaxID=1735103 RepID=A0A916RI66_9HYPH|nr:zinc ABC transporter substrate-binding protein ZnuA [Nitratireductor aestuarii]GGA58069.1 zinc ABC transporter substrate-binding protein [Nitratireductor aestuarii]